MVAVWGFYLFGNVYTCPRQIMLTELAPLMLTRANRNPYEIKIPRHFKTKMGLMTFKPTLVFKLHLGSS